jgi:hypothetical protein
MTPDQILELALARHREHEKDGLDFEVNFDDPAVAARVDRASSRLRLLLDDGLGDIEPPAGLARRTIERVERSRSWQGVLEYSPGGGSFRMADLAVAASIFLVGVLTLIPALQQSRWGYRTAVCSSNLRELGVSLIRYASTHGAYPFAGDSPSAPYAGSYASDLVRRGFLDDPRLLDCPVDGPNAQLAALPSFTEMARRGDADGANVEALRHGDYAYNIGYRDGAPPKALPASLSSFVPLLADRPASDDTGHALHGNSPNHARRGQHVLSAGGDVRFHRLPNVAGDPDIYHNRLDVTAPGLDPRDFVLAPGEALLDYQGP